MAENWPSGVDYCCYFNQQWNKYYWDVQKKKKNDIMFLRTAFQSWHHCRAQRPIDKSSCGLQIAKTKEKRKKEKKKKKKKKRKKEE